MRRSRLVLAIAILAATAVLVSLGFWQVRRLAWKEALIARVEERLAEPAQPLDTVLAQAGGDLDWRPMTASGAFDHSLEQYFYTTHKGEVGWNVFAPLKLPDGRWLIVNRGFVPDRLRDPATRLEGQVEGEVEISGLARSPVLEKPNSFMPDNRPDKRELYWRSHDQIAAAMGLDPATVLPVELDAGAADVPGGWPQGGTTIVEFPNSHLQYAVTWFGLAAACLGVGGWLLFARRDAGPHKA